jgi:hypothetical protein
MPEINTISTARGQAKNALHGAFEPKTAGLINAGHIEPKAATHARLMSGPDSRRALPYGMWTCADGREVLFNRSYQPLWQRRPGGRIEAADPCEYVLFKGRAQFFYSDWDRDKRVPLAKAAFAKWCGASPTVH